MKSKVFALVLLIAFSALCWAAEKKASSPSPDRNSAGSTEGKTAGLVQPSEQASQRRQLEEQIRQEQDKLRELVKALVPPDPGERADRQYQQLKGQIRQEQDKLRELAEALAQPDPAESKVPVPVSRSSLEAKFQMDEVMRDCHLMSLLVERIGRETDQKVRSLLLERVHDCKRKVQKGLDSAVRLLDGQEGSGKKQH